MGSKKVAGIVPHPARVNPTATTGATPCGSEPARDSGGSACINVECTSVIASRLAPTGGIQCS
ncbi:hypothetical protein DZG01_19600 [Pseudomonas fluorescens]|nr:hypothetical protein DZG01_19600 [Pseudomonas fluorescens]